MSKWRICLESVRNLEVDGTGTEEEVNEAQKDVNIVIQYA